MNRDRTVDFRLYLISDRAQCRAGSLEQVIEAACLCGVKAVQLREKDLDSRNLYETAVRLRAITGRTGARLMINDRTDVALAIGADGIHCPENGVPPAVARTILGEAATIGASVHSLEGAVRAAKAGADFVTFGPVFETPSKAAYGPPLGLGALATVTSRVRVPVLAIGGITRENAASCIDNGADGVALISAIMGANDIACSVAELKAVLDEL